MILQTWTTACGFWARCGGEDCQEVLLFQYPDDTETCDFCGSVCDLTGAIVEYGNVAMRLVQTEHQLIDGYLNDQAERGWVVDKMSITQEPGGTHIVAVYLLRRLVANQRFVKEATPG